MSKQILGFILALLGFLLSFWGFIPLAMSVVGLVLGCMALNEEKKGLAISAVVLGILGTLSAIFWTFVWTAVFASV